MSKKKTTNEFIAQAKKVHGDKYDYSITEYIDAKKKVLIICPVHGVFEQLPNSHLRSGCRKCGRDMIRKSLQEFIDQARAIHGDKYNYDQVVYKRSDRPVIIKCNECGRVFEQLPDSHLRGHGCTCINRHPQPKLRKTHQVFIEQ